MSRKILNNTTELVFILDRSGSMSGLESDVAGGFNAMLKEQKKLDGEVLVSCVLFDNNSEVLYDRVPIGNVPEMSADDFRVGGCTALLDAIGDAVHHIKNVHKYARTEDVPGKTIFVITTDGMENASAKYDSRTVKKLIEKYQENGWEFLFAAANIDAVETAKHIGIREDNAQNYMATPTGTADMYRVMSERVCERRKRK